jgi:hypothetical protein
MAPECIPRQARTMATAGGTIVCGVDATVEGRGAARLAATVAARLGLRLVVAGDGAHARAALDAVDIGLRSHVETEVRLLRGEHAGLLARVAAEEGADLIVLGGRTAGLFGRRIECPLAAELEAQTRTPIVIALEDGWTTP